MHLNRIRILNFTNIFLQLQGFVSTVGYSGYDGGHCSPVQDDLSLGRYFSHKFVSYQKLSLFDKIMPVLLAENVI